MSSYTYEISNDFSNGINLYILNKDIQEQLTKGFNIFPIGDKIIINFFTILDDNKKDILDTIIINHNPNNSVQGINMINISMDTHQINNGVYHTINTFIFPGTNNIDVTNIKLLSVMQEFGLSYDIRIIDTTNNSIIASVNLNNTDESVIDIKPINNLPSSEAIFDIQSKVNGPTIAYIKNLSIYFN